VSSPQLFPRLKEYIKNEQDVTLAVVVRGPDNLLGAKALIPAQGDPHGLLPVLNQGIVSIARSGRWEEIVHSYAPHATIRPIPATMTENIETYQGDIPGLD